jgi:hypothetical protein
MEEGELGTSRQFNKTFSGRKLHFSKISFCVFPPKCAPLFFHALSTTSSQLSDTLAYDANA